MQDQTQKEVSDTRELVFALTLHPVLGWLIEPFAVSRNAKGLFEYDFKKLARNTVWDYFDTLSPSLEALFALTDRYSDENLHKRFARGKVRLRDFFESIDDDLIKKHIRPFIERSLYEVVLAMTLHNIKLYLKGESRERIQEKPIRIHPRLAETCFHFEKLEHKTHYHLEVLYDGRPLSLYKSNALLITHKPCVLMLNHEVYCFEREWEGQKLKPFINKEYLETPASSEKEFYEKFVQKSIARHPFIAKGFEVRSFEGNPQPVLRIEQHWQGDVVLGLYFGYGKQRFAAGDPLSTQVKFVHKWPEFHFQMISRQKDFENALVSFLKDQGLKRLDGPFFRIPDEEKPLMADEAFKQQLHACVDWISARSDLLGQKNFLLEKELANRSFYTGFSDLAFETTEKNDWFDLYGKVWFGEFEIPFSSLRDNILSGDREFVLPNGSIALIPEEWMTMYHDLLMFAKPKGDVLEIRKHHFALMKSIPQQGLQLPEFQPMRDDETFDLPEALHADLRPYQQAGYQWMMFLRQNGLGGCLADDMGLGKTLQALALLCRVHLHENHNDPDGGVLREDSSVFLKDQKTSAIQGQLSMFDDDAPENVVPDSHIHPCSLVIMPLSLIHNWSEEARRFAPSLKVGQHTGVNRSSDISFFNRYHVVLTTYGTVRNDIDLLSSYPFRYVILDESQIIKNASSKVFTAIKRLQCMHRLVLSGTPVENSLTDLWSQFSFINPGMLGSLNFFRNEFVNPIERKQDEIAGKKLQNLIQPFILRRTKEQVAPELPELTEKIHYCEMTPEQQSYYEARKSEVRNALLHGLETHGTDKSRFLVLSALTKLRLIANHPAIVDSEFDSESGKYNEIIRNVEKLLSENHKVLIFSQFVKHLNLFGEYFRQRGYEYSMLTGKVQEKERKKLIERFQTQPDNRLFLISLKAGGVGLNLTGADYVFLLDPWWNPAVENQAINRAHRIGQDKHVFVYKFITRNTVEEKILKLQERKSHLAGMFINENNPLKSLSLEELQELI